MRPVFLLALLFAALPAGAEDPMWPKDAGVCPDRSAIFQCNDQPGYMRFVTAKCTEKHKPVYPPSATPDERPSYDKNAQDQVANCVRVRVGTAAEICAECARLVALQPQPGPGPRPGPQTRPDKQDKPEEPRERPDTAECHSESCLRRAAREQREAEALARQRRIGMERAAREAQKNKSSTITTAADFLDQWGQSLARNPKASPQEQSQYQNDRRLFERAVSGQPFTPADAQGAQSAFVRDALDLYAETEAQESHYQREGEKSAKSETEFRQLAQRTETRAGTLGQATGGRAPAADYPLSNGAPAPAGGKTSAPLGQSTIAVTNGGSAAGETRARKTEAFLPAAGAGKGDKSVSQNAGGRPGASGPGLRDLLKRRLAEKGKASQPGGAVTGGARDLERRGKALWSEGEPPVADFAADMLAEAEQGKAPDYAIGAEETSRQLQRMMADAGLEDGQGGTGLLGVDTANLFERVRHAHRSCQARDCVR